jgi:hypothetical protein
VNERLQPQAVAAGEIGGMLRPCPRSPPAAIPKPQQCWHVFYGDVRVGSISIRSAETQDGTPHRADIGSDFHWNKPWLNLLPTALLGEVVMSHHVRAAVFGNRGCDTVREERCHPRMRSLFVMVHEPRIAGDVGGQYLRSTRTGRSSTMPRDPIQPRAMYDGSPSSTRNTYPEADVRSLSLS